MSDTTLIYNVRLAGEDTAEAWILISGQHISAVGHGDTPEASTYIDGNGALALPGVIDCHVHFREPGLTAKADISSESRAAVAGGVTSYLEMPNTLPPTTTLEAWQHKMDLAARNSVANYAFFIGATNDNIDQLVAADYTRIPGVKLFMGSSTGNMLVDDQRAIARIFDSVDAIVAVHAEDQDIISENTARYVEKYGSKEAVGVEHHSVIRSAQACMRSTETAVRLAREHNRRLHICHITTADELALLQRGEVTDKLITSEVSPHHLMWCDSDYATRGTRIKMNPAVKTANDRDSLRRAVRDGLIDIVATDHAPHQLSDKQGGALTAASGAPLVQFSLPWMLDNFDETTVQRVMCQSPARLYGIDRRGELCSGYYADIALVQTVEPYTVTDSDVISKCGWTPLDGTVLRHRVTQTWVNGQRVYPDVPDAPLSSAPLTFSRR